MSEAEQLDSPAIDPAVHQADPLVVERVILLSRVATSKEWHKENLSDPAATPQDKRQSRDRKREAARRLAEFDQLHKHIAPPEE